MTNIARFVYRLKQRFITDRVWPMTTAGVWLDFVNREDWGAMHLTTGRLLSSNNVANVLLLHTATENCFELTECKEFVYAYQVSDLNHLYLLL